MGFPKRRNAIRTEGRSTRINFVLSEINMEKTRSLAAGFFMDLSCVMALMPVG